MCNKTGNQSHTQFNTNIYPGNPNGENQQLGLSSISSQRENKECFTIRNLQVEKHDALERHGKYVGKNLALKLFP